MANKVLTAVLQTVEGVASDVNPILAAVINAAHEAGHIVQEIRIMEDSGEKKVPPNTVPGVTVEPPKPPAPPETAANAPGVPATAPPSTVTDVTTTGQVEGATSDTTVKEPPIDNRTIAEKRDALMAQLEELDKEEEANDASAVAADVPPSGTTTTPTEPVDPTVPVDSGPPTA